MSTFWNFCEMWKAKFWKPNGSVTFHLEFHVEPDDYFTNEVLTKTYTLKSKLHYSDPHSLGDLQWSIALAARWNARRERTHCENSPEEAEEQVWGTDGHSDPGISPESFNFFNTFWWGLDVSENKEESSSFTFCVPWSFQELSYTSEEKLLRLSKRG